MIDKSLIVRFSMAVGLWCGLVECCHADLVYDGIGNSGGTGTGTVSYALSIQANGIERGCLKPDSTPVNGEVGIQGVAGCDVDGPSAAADGRAEVSVTALRQLSLVCDAVGECITRASQLRIALLPSQLANGALNMDDLVFKVYNTSGMLIFSASLAAAPFSLQSSDPGPAAIGFLFRLDNPEQLQQLGVFNNPSAYFIALQASVTNGSGGAERFYITSTKAVGVPEHLNPLFVDGFESQ